MARFVVAGALSVGALAACGGGDEAATTDATGSPTSGASASSGAYAEVPQADGLDRIRVSGVEGSPIRWRLSSPAVAGSPVAVAQRFLALHILSDTAGSRTDPAIVSGVATGDQLAVTRNRVLGRTDGRDETGPLWVWLDTAAESGDRAEVRGCADVGFFQPPGTATPAPPPERAQAWRTELQQGKDYDGSTVWKVSVFSRGPVDDGNLFEARCAAWATHTP